jgi:hypothetical protein
MDGEPWAQIEDLLGNGICGVCLYAHLESVR